MEKGKCSLCGKIELLKGNQCSKCAWQYCFLISFLPEFIVLDEIVKAGGIVPFKQMKPVLERVKQLSPDVSKDYNIGSLIALADLRLWYSKTKEGLVPTEEGLKIHKDFCGAAYYFYNMEGRVYKKMDNKTFESIIENSLPFDFSNYYITETTLMVNDLTGTRFVSSRLDNVTFKEVNLSGVDFSKSEFIFVTFIDCNLKGCNFDLVDHLCCKFVNCNLHEADLSRIKKQFFDLLTDYPSAGSTMLALIREGKVEGANNQDQLPYSLLNAVSIQCNKCVWHLVEKYKLVHKFGNLSMGETPEKSPIAKILENWILEFERS